jgi:hypothetical protein
VPRTCARIIFPVACHAAALVAGGADRRAPDPGAPDARVGVAEASADGAGLGLLETTSDGDGESDGSASADDGEGEGEDVAAVLQPHTSKSDVRPTTSLGDTVCQRIASHLRDALALATAWRCRE